MDCCGENLSLKTHGAQQPGREALDRKTFIYRRQQKENNKADKWWQIKARRGKKYLRKKRIDGEFGVSPLFKMRNGLQ
jgi:hypothetical protein